MERVYNKLVRDKIPEIIMGKGETPVTRVLNDEEYKKSLEEKAANLLYFIVKDHPFIDGCKRIAAGLFLFYLSKNALLSINKLTISNGTLTAITLLVAESRPEEKEIMINIIMTILFNKM